MIYLCHVCDKLEEFFTFQEGKGFTSNKQKRDYAFCLLDEINKSMYIFT